MSNNKTVARLVAYMWDRQVSCKHIDASSVYRAMRTCVQLMRRHIRQLDSTSHCLCEQCARCNIFREPQTATTPSHYPSSGFWHSAGDQDVQISVLEKHDSFYTSNAHESHFDAEVMLDHSPVTLDCSLVFLGSVAQIGGGGLCAFVPPLVWESFERPLQRSLRFQRKNWKLSNATQIRCDLIESFKSLSFSHITGLHIYEIWSSILLKILMQIWIINNYKVNGIPSFPDFWTS